MTKVMSGYKIVHSEFSNNSTLKLAPPLINQSTLLAPPLIIVRPKLSKAHISINPAWILIIIEGLMTKVMSGYKMVHPEF